MKRFVRLIAEILGVPVVMTIQAYVLIVVLFLQQEWAWSSFTLRWGGISAMTYLGAFAIWSEESQRIQAQEGERDERAGWALIAGLLFGLIILLTALLWNSSWSTALGRGVIGICVFGQQICFWIAAHTGAREFR